MKKGSFLLPILLVLASFLAGCATQTQTSKQDAIPFTDSQYYAVAHLGYQSIDHLEYYTEHFLDSDSIPIHYLSDGDYYLIIPRYPGMKLSLYRNDLDTSEPVLIFEDPDCQPFILQCNVSDIFADATIRLSYQEETIEFSPFISLKDGSVDVGSQGLNLTQDTSLLQPGQ